MVLILLILIFIILIFISNLDILGFRTVVKSMQWAQAVREQEVLNVKGKLRNFLGFRLRY